MTPRILLSAPCSGAGKTTVTCALLQALVNRGLTPMACKCGPDYIDPMFHSRIIGAKSGNLDLFFCPENTVSYLLKRASQNCDVTVLEGAMGYYDGIGLSERASAWAVACATKTPAVLVMDARGSGVSLCAAIEGFQRFQRDSRIQGVILNRVSPMFYPRLKAAIEERCGLRVYGYLPHLPECALESRHLGLVTPKDVEQLQEKMQKLAAQAEKSLDIDRLLALANTAPALAGERPPLPPPVPGNPVIAVAGDEAFCFYYEDNFRLLEELGGKLVFFSPLHDAHLPPCDGLYLGGGYPELYARELSENETMRREICQAVTGGLPAIAECGGFLYLHETLEDNVGTRWPMAGVIPAGGYRTDRLSRFGYVTLKAQKDNLLCKQGDCIPAHEFHYWDSTAAGDTFHAQKPQSTRGWDCVHGSETLYAGFPHLHFYGNPWAAQRFLSAAARSKREKA